MQDLCLTMQHWRRQQVDWPDPALQRVLARKQGLPMLQCCAARRWVPPSTPVSWQVRQAAVPPKPALQVLQVMEVRPAVEMQPPEQALAA